MNTLGKICTALVLLLAPAWFYLGGKLLKTANDWSVKIRESKSAADKAVTEHEKSELELSVARSELARIKLGWGQEWTFPAGAGGTIQVSGRNLAVTGIGTENGLAVRTFQDPAGGAEKTLAPTVHVFLTSAADSSRYVGEFIADLSQLSTNSCLLLPTWPVTAEEIASWDFSKGFRMRTLVPIGPRTEVEGLNQALQGMRERYGVLLANIQNQTALQAAAEKQLAQRRAELLGNPDAPAVDDRPEFQAGLVQALSDTEESRNALQSDVDDLRRRIRNAAVQRSALVEEVSELAAALSAPAADSKISRSRD